MIKMIVMMIMELRTFEKVRKNELKIVSVNELK